MAPAPSRAPAWLGPIPLVAGATVMLVGLAALAGWQFDQPLLKSLVPGRVAMNPVTALCFILAGLSLVLRREPLSPAARSASMALAGAVALVGSVKIAELLFHADLGLDRILFRSKLEAYVPPNRMAPNTAFNFLCAGLALALIDVGAASRRRPTKCLALVPHLFSFLGLIGYFYDVRSFYGLTSYIPMAPNTVVAFLTLCTGIMVLYPDQGLTRVFTSEDLGGSLARRLFPVSVGALLFLGWLRLVGEGAALFDTHVGVSLQVFVSCVLIGTVIWTSAHSLSRVDGERRRAAEALQLAHDGLERRVEERTAELVGANTALEREGAERKQAQEALRKSEEQLRQSQKMEAIGRLAGGVAHDFNNMLTAILGHSQLMRMRMAPDNPGYRDTEEIELAAQRAASLTRQLLAFSRQQVLEPRVLDLNTLISEMDRMLRRIIGADVDMLAAPAPSLGRVKADPGQIEQVLLNLVVNARDALPKGGKITIETANVDLDETYARSHAGARPGAYVLLAVSDTGCGIDPEIRARIFEPFFTTKETGKGTGLGLSTVYGIVKQSGGLIDVYSEVGHGTTFKVYLPRLEGTVAEIAARPRPNVAAARGTETVLLVEDEDLVRAVIRQTLELHGYHVVEASDGNQALHALQSSSRAFDLIVTDVVMPRMSGLEFAERAARISDSVKVLLISGYTDRAIAHRGIQSPRTAYLQKPFPPDVLARKVREVLDGPEAQVA
jgi:signal transduction histidine kinase/ActR/RegA family two-component response regulator